MAPSPRLGARRGGVEQIAQTPSAAPQFGGQQGCLGADLLGIRMRQRLAQQFATQGVGTEQGLGHGEQGLAARPEQGKTPVATGAQRARG